VSELRSALEAYRSEVLSELPDSRAEEVFIELWRAKELLETECLRRLPDLEVRGIFERDGHLSAASWLASRFKLAWGAARGFVQMARGLREMPVTREAMESGDLSVSAARVLVDARDTDPAAFEEVEAALVEAARIHSLGDLGRVAAYWRQAAEADHGLEREQKLRDQRRLHLSASLFGMLHADGLFDPESAEVIQTAVRAILDHEAHSRDPEDHRTPAQRRADAVVEICRQFLDRSDRPTVGGERPHVTVTVDAAMLRNWATGDGPVAAPPGTGARMAAAVSQTEDGSATKESLELSGRLCELEHAGPISVHTARRIACDASIQRVVMAGTSEPLDVGRRTPVIPAAIRRAVILRDRHCTFPDCDRPAPWCDVHHIEHWANGGETSLANSTLQCKQHHGWLHPPGGFRLTREDGRLVFRRPDGSVLEADRTLADDRAADDRALTDGRAPADDRALEDDGRLTGDRGPP
jgi:uncharacterized protein DUF222